VFVQLGYVQLGYDTSPHRPDRVLVESVESGVDRLTPELMRHLAASIVPEADDGT